MIVFVAPSAFPAAGRFICKALDLLHERFRLEALLVIEARGAVKAAIEWGEFAKVPIKRYPAEKTTLRADAMRAAIRAALEHGQPCMAVTIASEDSTAEQECASHGVRCLRGTLRYYRRKMVAVDWSG